MVWPGLQVASVKLRRQRGGAAVGARNRHLDDLVAMARVQAPPACKGHRMRRRLAQGFVFS